MNEIEQLRAELTQLRHDTTVMLTALAAVLPQLPGAAHAALALANNLGRTLHKGTGPQFEEMATQVLLAASSSGLKMWPEDTQLQALYQGLRSCSRH